MLTMEWRIDSKTHEIKTVSMIICHAQKHNGKQRLPWIIIATFQPDVFGTSL